ncbi:MAG: hypothetical protein B7Z80_04035 [Rhodospirillales bacterium 20-64-7]|nr:MAG: hypothetical protein B7Z80_04035 [Rhodospirillales bacterium 20-64-7]
MAIPDAVVVSPSLNLAFGTLTLTSERLLFEPDRLTIRAKERVFALSEIVVLETTWTRVFRLVPLWPTLVVRTSDGATHSFAAVRPTSLGPRRWIAAIREAQASRAGASSVAATDGSLPDEIKAEHLSLEGLVQGVSSPVSGFDPAVWYYEREGTRIGPVTRAVLDHNRFMGLIGSDTRISEDGGPWKPASSLDEAGHSLGSAAPASPPLPADDRFAWAIVAVPLVGALMEFLLGSELGLLYLIANVLLCLWDRRRLAEAGYPTPSGWWALLIPGYLLKRSALLGQRQIFAGAWLLAFVASLLLASWGHRETLADSACPLVTQIIQEQLNGSATCKGVEIVRDVGNGFYVGKATLDNGRELTITIEDKGKNIEVQIPSQ